MARLTIYRNPTRGERQHTPFLLDAQTGFLPTLATRVVVPLRTRAGFPPPIEAPNPVFEVDGREVVLDTAALAALPRSALPVAVASLSRPGLDTDNALDFRFQGL